jgi:hypothetical protein
MPKWNPVTRQMEPDPNDPNDMPMPGLGPDAQGDGGGPGVPPPADAVIAPPPQPVFPPKPTWEEKTTTAGKVKSAGTAAAEKATDAASAAVDEAQSKVDQVAGQEDLIGKDFADRAVAEKNRQAEDRRVREELRQKWVGERQAADDKEIEEERQAANKAGKAHESFWEGRPAARVFAALLQGIGQTVEQLQGRSGPSPAERIINEKIAAHKDKLVTAWKATKEANDLKRTNRAEYEKELDRREIVANKENELQLNLIEDELKAAVAGLAPAKRQAASELATKTTQEARARLREERARTYDRTFEKEEVNRSETSSPNAGKASSSQEKASADLNEMAGTLEEIQKGAPLTKQSIEKFAKNQEEVAATSNPQGYGEVLKNRGLRKVGALAEGAMDGIPKEQREQIRRIEKVRVTQQRIISGAAVTAEEKKELTALYGINLGDSPKDIASKLAGLAKALRERTVEAGPVMGPKLQERFDKLAGGGKAAPANDNSKIQMVNGRKARVYSDGTAEYID